MADYSQNILQAEKASDEEEKAQYYLSAVDIMPLRLDAYQGLIDTFKEDAVFTVEEETQLKKKLNAHLTQLREQPGYARLAFEVGKLYWYYYDYGAEDGSDSAVMLS